MLWDILATYVGAFLYAFTVYNLIIILLNFFSRNKMMQKKVLISSFIISVFLTFLIAAVTNYDKDVIVYYMPMLILVFWLDYRKNMYKKCPYCSERIRSDAVICKHCHSNLKEVVNR